MVVLFWGYGGFVLGLWWFCSGGYGGFVLGVMVVLFWGLNTPNCVRKTYA